MVENVNTPEFRVSFAKVFRAEKNDLIKQRIAVAARGWKDSSKP